jgi:uncharacterized protein (TIGR03067 family)
MRSTSFDLAPVQVKNTIFATSALSGPEEARRWGRPRSAIGKSMKNFIGLILVFFVPLPLCADDANDVRKELLALEGVWKAMAMEAGGMPFPKDRIPDFVFIVSADGKAIGRSPQGEYQAKITVDPHKNPKTIVNLHQSGAQKGKEQFGVYKLEGDRWTVCMTLPGVAESDRPKDFSTQDTANVVFVFERQKDAKKP